MSKRQLVIIGWLVFVLALAIGLRVSGMKWGLPNDLHYYSYHPDENMVLGATDRINFFEGKLDPGFYNYGSLFLYLSNFDIQLATGFGYINIDPHEKDEAVIAREIGKEYLVGRITALILGVLTVLLLFFIGQRAYGRDAGILAAIFLAIMPLHVMHSKFMAVDVPAAFFVTAAILFAVRMSQEGFRTKDFVWAGIFTGLAAATKYNAGLVILVPLVIFLMPAQNKPALRSMIGKGLLIPAAALIGFLVGTPGILINPHAFFRDFTYELHHAATGHGLVFVNTGLGWVYHLTHSLLPGMGLPLILLSIAGIVYAIKKHSAVDVALLVFLFVYYFVIGLAQVRFARYTIIILPVLALFAARLAMLLSPPADKKVSCNSSIWTPIISILVLFYTANTYSSALDIWMARQDTRDTAIVWINKNIPHGSSIGLATIPWFYTPPFYPLLASPASADVRYQMMQQFTGYKLSTNKDKEWDADYLKSQRPQYVVLSESEYTDRLRLHDPDAAKYFDELKRDYVLARKIENKLQVTSVIPRGKLPHDMSYPSPTILIYKRNSGG